MSELDPAMIEEVALVLYGADEEGINFDRLHPAARKAYLKKARAVAAVIVPATAEQWARHFDDLAAASDDQEVELQKYPDRKGHPTFAAHRAMAFRNAAQILRGFAAAGAGPGGGSDDLDA